ncbi:zonadhesin-like [Leptopilina heterotoma]|uniref:zonadhesin-like n=1 Tax=Leptopilina heterotoma TaxID=63436 RepID=UPI001CA92F34|nr:zonadhesin-like [Leptopilina heterotoma]
MNQNIPSAHIFKRNAIIEEAMNEEKNPKKRAGGTLVINGLDRMIFIPYRHHNDSQELHEEGTTKPPPIIEESSEKPPEEQEETSPIYSFEDSLEMPIHPVGSKPCPNDTSSDSEESPEEISFTDESDESSLDIEESSSDSEVSDTEESDSSESEFSSGGVSSEEIGKPDYSTTSTERPEPTTTEKPTRPPAVSTTVKPTTAKPSRPPVVSTTVKPTTAKPTGPPIKPISSESCEEQGDKTEEELVHEPGSEEKPISSESVEKPTRPPIEHPGLVGSSESCEEQGESGEKPTRPPGGQPEKPISGESGEKPTRPPIQHPGLVVSSESCEEQGDKTEEEPLQPPESGEKPTRPPVGHPISSGSAEISRPPIQQPGITISSESCEEQGDISEEEPLHRPESGEKPTRPPIQHPGVIVSSESCEEQGDKSEEEPLQPTESGEKPIRPPVVQPEKPISTESCEEQDDKSSPTDSEHEPSVIPEKPVEPPEKPSQSPAKPISSESQGEDVPKPPHEISLIIALLISKYNYLMNLFKHQFIHHPLIARNKIKSPKFSEKPHQEKPEQLEISCEEVTQEIDEQFVSVDPEYNTTANYVDISNPETFVSSESCEENGSRSLDDYDPFIANPDLDENSHHSKTNESGKFGNFDDKSISDEDYFKPIGSHDGDKVASPFFGIVTTIRPQFDAECDDVCRRKNFLAILGLFPVNCKSTFESCKLNVTDAITRSLNGEKYIKQYPRIVEFLQKLDLNNLKKMIMNLQPIPLNSLPPPYLLSQDNRNYVNNILK